MIRLMTLVSAASGVAFAATSLAATANPSEDAFLRRVVSGDTAAIALGGLIERKGSTPAMRMLGAMLMRQHTANRSKAEALAKSMGVATPEVIRPGAQQAHDQLSDLSGDAFDRQARAAVIRDHEEDVSAYEMEAHTSDVKTSAFARMALPTSQEHLSMAKALPR